MMIWESVNKRKETEKKITIFFLKTSKKKKEMALNLFEFQKQFIVYTFLIASAQFEKTGSIDEFIIPLVNLKL